MSRNHSSRQLDVFIAIVDPIRYYSSVDANMLMPAQRLALSFILALAWLLNAAWAVSQVVQEPNARPATVTAPSSAQIKDCLRQAESAECLDKLFREMLKTSSTVEALELIQRFEKEDPELRRDCHPVVHAVGRETFRLKGNIHDSFSACDQTCHSGCYHGSVERFLRGQEIYAQANKHPTQAELKHKAASACDPQLAARVRFQCFHGLGHALLYFSRYQLMPSLEACDALAEEWSRSSCYGGVFMENVSSATPELRDLSPTDYHYPCNKLGDQYRDECYVMQTSRMVEMGLTTEELFRECAAAGPFGANCALSVGRDLSNQARLGDSAGAARKCELAQGRSRQACIRGVAYALIDNTWDGRYAWTFCAALAHQTDQNGCLQESIGYLKVTFEKTAEELSKDCGRLASISRRCAEFAMQ